MTIQTLEAEAANMAVQTLQAEPTQSHASGAHNRTDLHMIASLVMLVSLGLIPSVVSASSLVLTYPGQSESTYSVRGPEKPHDFDRVTDALSRIHETLLNEAKELDPTARRVLNQHLWDLYIT